MSATPARSTRAIVAFALPASAEVGFQTLLALVDLAMVGHLGEAAVAAVGLIGTIQFLLLLSLGTVGAGGAVLVAQWFGRGDPARVARYAGQILAVGLVAGLVVSVVLASSAGPILRFIGADPEVVDVGTPVLALIGGGFALPLMTVLGGEMLRAVGQSRAPFAIGITTVVANTLLNWLLIFGVGPFPEMGATGAALATVVARALGFALLLAYLASGRSPLRLAPRDLFGFDPRALRDLLRVAWPVMVGESLWSLGTFLYAMMFARAGTAALAASQVTGTLEGVFIMSAFGLSVAGLALVGQDLGAGDPARAERTARQILRLGLWVALGGAILSLAAILAVPALYPELDSGTTRLVAGALLVGAAILPIRITNMIFGNGVLRGGGDARFVMVTDACVMFAVGVPVALVGGFVLDFGFWGVLAGRVVEEAVRLALLTARFRSGRWARNLTEAPAVAA